MWESALSISTFPPPRAPGDLCAEPELLKELCLCLLHAHGGFGVAVGLCDAQQGVGSQPRAQVLGWVVECKQGLQRGLIAVVADAFATLVVDGNVGLGAGAVIVQIGVEEVAIEAVEPVGASGIDVAVAEVLADDGAVLGLHQAVVVGVSGPALGLADAQLVEQAGHGLVEELAAVVGVKALDAEGELAQHLLQHRLQKALRDARRGHHDLPLGDFVDGVDVVNALGIGAVSLMHGVDAEKAGLAGGIGAAPLADGHRGGPGLGVSA